MPSQLDVASLPVEIAHVWDWWFQLNKTRQSGMDICRITFEEIKAWKELYELKISPFEIECLVVIDDVYMSVRSEQQARKQTSKPQD